MANVSVTQMVNAPLSAVWASWDDFGSIDLFHSGLKGSRLINNSAATGQGAMRQCDMADGKNYIRERITKYVPEKELVVDIYEGTLPLKSAVATFNFVDNGAAQTAVTMEMEFVPKFGLLGKMMIPMMKPQFRTVLAGLLKGNADFVERGGITHAAA